MKWLYSHLGAVLTTMTGAAIAIFAEPLRQKIFSPKLQLEFSSEPEFVTRTPEGDHEAIYIRVKVINTSTFIAKNCRAYLVGIDRQDDSGRFYPTQHYESLQLAWASRLPNPFEPIDLPKGVVQYVDIVSTRSTSDQFRLECQTTPLRYESLFSEHRTFRFKILVSGENFKPKCIPVLFSPSSSWNCPVVS